MILQTLNQFNCIFSNYDYKKYMDEIEKVKTREFTTFYFNDRKNKDIQDLSGRQYNDKYEFGGKILEYQEEKSVIEIKNKLAVGDTIEIIIPNRLEPETFEITKGGIPVNTFYYEVYYNGDMKTRSDSAVDFLGLNNALASDALGAPGVDVYKDGKAVSIKLYYDNECKDLIYTFNTTLKAVDISSASFSTSSSAAYNGQYQSPSGITLNVGSTTASQANGDLRIVFENNKYAKDVGSYKYAIEGVAEKGYTGSTGYTGTFTIDHKTPDEKSLSVVLSGTAVYNGTNTLPTVTVTDKTTGETLPSSMYTVKWNTGALPYETASYNLTPNQIYNYEKGTNTGKTNYENHNDFPVDNVERTYYWYGQVGLISPTDLIMAGSDSSDMSRESCMMSSSNYYYCINNNNWFRNMSTNSYYAINPAFSPSNNSSYYPYIGYSIYNSPYTTPVASSNAILPTVYLKTNVSVKSGDGTSSNPYVLELLDKKNTHKYYGLASNIEKEETNAEENIIKTEKTNNDYKQLKSFTFIYGFTYDEETKTYTNENINIPNSRAISAIKIDLTNETEEKTILFNYDFKSSSYLSEMYINVMVGKYTPVDYFATTGPNSIYSVGPVLANSTSSITSSVKYTFKPGQQFLYQHFLLCSVLRIQFI